MIYVADLTTCRCGHPAIEHYDSRAFCTRTIEGECACERFVPDGEEVLVPVGPEEVSRVIKPTR